ncbi:hypothetical protein [Oribacterium sp. P9]|nr:hypothetical protein [Oribacterium sp.]
MLVEEDTGKLQTLVQEDMLEKEFIGTDALDGEGVNYIGTTRK